MSDKIPVISLSGTPRNMGLSFGESYRREIQEFALLRLNRLKMFLMEYSNIAVDNKSILNTVQEVVPWHRAYNYDIWNEFRGIATGAGISDELLLVSMAYTDLRDYFIRRYHPLLNTGIDPGGCSAFIVPRKLAANGVLIGQTWDMSPEAIRYLVLVRRKPVNAPETLYLTTAGCLALIGINSHGVAIGNTNLMTSDHISGVNYLFTISAALQADTALTAAGTIINTPRLSGHNFFAADQDAAFNIEASSLQSKNTPVTDEIHIHTNHCLDPEMKKLELPRHVRWQESSTYRYQRMKQLFTKTALPLNIHQCWEILGDRKSNSSRFAICMDDVDQNNSDVATVATCILSPAERKIHVCAGGADNEKMQEISL
ncbi:C45 family autoproteolytic acyltransferase/hydolase [Chitinophaga solisilvae]|uniref:C45 family autoproteolytic acyltransferase/hydolase n=1 Tax=Chitinophaga solisilvae TaxID=1233460 RepID=UPI0021CEF9CD|nr:C45 family peptidase [Chitinophaga solisilvae]